MQDAAWGPRRSTSVRGVFGLLVSAGDCAYYGLMVLLLPGSTVAL